MATVLDIIKGLNQAAANGYDGSEIEENIGLLREEGDPILDSRVMDGFRVRFSADKMIVTYQAECMLKETHPRNQFENEIERRFVDIVKFLKKEYKNITKNSVTLSETAPVDILVQTTSRVRTWVQAKKQYTIGGMSEAIANRRDSEQDADRPYEQRFRAFMELASDKRPSNDTSSKNPDTPEA
tara:strand:+ start:596 stop:1147 length:552 start_codon:yes stop_codon:yes gene_type:complete